MKFLIFDIDGTLTNTKKIDDKCFIKAFKQTFKIDIRNQKWENLKNVTDWGVTEEIIHREWNRKPNKDDYEMMVSNYVTILNEERIKDRAQFSEIPGAIDFFYALKEIDEFKLGIATGAWEKSAKLKLEAIGIELDGVCFSNSDYHKSREAITKDVIEQLTRKNQKIPKQIIYFGDGEWDFKTCLNLEIEFIGIDVENDGKLKRLGAKTVFTDYSNREQIMSKLKEAV